MPGCRRVVHVTSMFHPIDVLNTLFRLYNTCLSTQYCSPVGDRTSPPGGDAGKPPRYEAEFVVNQPYWPEAGRGRAEIAIGRYATLKYA